MSPEVQEYIAPNGAVDFPFTYVYDASALTDGNTYQNINVQLQNDSDFVLRAIRGLPTVLNTGQNGGRFSYRDAVQRYANSNTSTGIVPAANEPVLPEKIYPSGSSLFLDLYTVLRSVTACGGTPIYNSQVGFMGVKRFPAGSFYQQPQAKNNFKRKPRNYIVSLTINWAHFDSSGSVQPVHQFVQPVQDYDFELYGVRISLLNQTTPLQTNDFQFTLYDRNFHATSSAPMNQGYINSARVSPQAAPAYRAAWPSPVLIYPQGSQIVFDILSMLCSTSLPQSYVISFVGCWRIPC